MPESKEKLPEGSCEDCLYFDYDEESDEETADKVCQLNLDEDEMESLMARRFASCPYYRYYDEYKFVQKQN